jgi:trk system potassium uptake protein TrkA
MKFLIVGNAKDVLELVYMLKKAPRDKHEFVVLTDSQEDVEAITREIDVPVFSGDLFDENLYLEAGLREIDVVIAMHENDMVNVFASMLAKEYKVPKVISVVGNKTIAKMLKGRGITEWVVERSNSICEKIENYILGFTWNEFGDNVLIVGSAENIPKLVERTVKELESEGIKVLAIIRDNTLLELKEDSVIKNNDIVMLFGSKGKVLEFLM